MPIQIEESKTPGGHLLMRTRVSGFVTLADAEGMGALLKPGQRYHGALLLSVVDKDVEYATDARRHFQTFNGNYKKMAVVVTSALVRAAINFMVRVTGQKIAFQMFTDEATALAWLDQ